MLEYDNLISLLKDNNYDKCIEHLYTNIDNIQKIYSKYSKKVNIFEIDNIKTRNKENSLFIRDIILTIVINKSSTKLDETNEILNAKTKIKYVLNIANVKIIKKLFFLYLLTYNFEVLSQDNIYYVGVDYEFSKRIIALMQLNFETPSFSKKTTYSYLWIINPGTFNQNEIDLLINNLMIEQKIIKILHGCDSLDYPYMIDEMFSKSKSISQQFTNSFIDTRYLCELYKISVGDTLKKCAIYDALLFFKTISQDKYDFLENSHDNMGPVQDVEWNINKMSSFHIKYALYDVLFLKHYLFDIFRMALTNTKEKIIYKYLITIVRFVLLEKKEVTLISKTIKTEIDPINNYLIKHNNNNYTLITIYNDIIKDFIVSKFNISINLLLEINYIKSNFILLLKRIIYGIITSNFRVKKNKNEMMNYTLPISELYSELENSKYSKLIKFLKEFEKDAFTKIMNKFRK